MHGCTDPYTQIIVTVDSDLQVPGQLDALEIEVSNDSQTASTPWVRPTALHAGMLPVSLALNSEGGKTPWVTVRVRGKLHVAGGVLTVVERSARARFERGKTLELHIDLLRACAATVNLGVLVREPVACSPGLTCGEQGKCEDPTRASLPAYAGLPAKRPLSESDGGARDAGQSDAQMADSPHDGGEPVEEPEPSDPNNVVDFALGSAHSCALKQSGAVYCWGSNKSGALARTFETDPLCPEGSICRAPRRVPKLVQIVHIAAGDQFSCALDRFERVLCWGDNSYGQLGLTVHEPYLSEPVVAYENVRGMAVGSTFVCVIDAESSVRCWGDASRSQTGAPVEGEDRTMPNRVLEGAGQIALGGAHGCAALRADGGLVCWGDNNAMQLGSPTPSQSLAPLPLGGQPTLFSLGNGHTCFATAADDKRILCVGRDKEDQLGPNASSLAMCPDPEAPAGVSDFACTSKLVPVDLDAPPLSLALGGHFSCALLDDEHTGVEGRVVCWGDNLHGELDDSLEPRHDTPQSINLPLVRLLGAGQRHACAARGPSMWCWGANEAGQLGTLATDHGDRSLPVKVTLPSE